MATKSKPKAKPKESKKEAPEQSERTAPGRPIWKGSIAFGLVNVPVRLFSLESKADLHFKMLDSRNHAGIRYERVNEETGKEVPWDQIVKGFEYSDGNYVVLTEEDFDKVKVESTQTVEITDFVKREEIDDMFFEKPYLVLPERKAEKGYVLLREALGATGTAGIAKVVIRTREYLAAVLPKGHALVLVLMRFDQELKRVEDFNLPREEPSAYRISEREQSLAESLIESMTTEWKPEQYRDEYREALMKWIEEKATKGDMAEVEEPEREARRETANVIDLAELLRKSVKPAKGEAANGKPKKQRAS